jgi:hypothetical protein
LKVYASKSASSPSVETLAVSLAKPKLTAEIIILILIINKMKKVLVANITSTALVASVSKKEYDHEFELKELNKHLSEGWEISKYDIVTNQTGNTFTIIYQLSK